MILSIEIPTLSFMAISSVVVAGSGKNASSVGPVVWFECAGIYFASTFLGYISPRKTCIIQFSAGLLMRPFLVCLALSLAFFIISISTAHI